MPKKPEEPIDMFFDSNIFGELVAPNNADAVSWSDIIEAKVSEGHIRIIPSWQTIREIFFVLEKDNNLSNQRDLYRHISDWLYVLKPAEDILRDDILSFAQTGKPELPFVRPNHFLWNYINHIRFGKKLFSKSEFEGLYASQRVLDQGFVKNVLMGVDPEKAKEVRKSKGKSQPNVEIQWINLWQPGDSAHKMAIEFADSLNVLNQCEHRGIKKLLSLPTIRLTIGYILHSWYMQIMNKKTNFQPSDAMDFCHATCAGAVGNIVTSDNKLRAAIEHIPNNNVKAWALRELVDYCVG
jgi:hypothetical protein